jgi:hypothetical protein
VLTEESREMTKQIGPLLSRDTVALEYDVHDMRGALEWYRHVFGFQVVPEGGQGHTELALPPTRARLALGLPEGERVIEKGGRLFLRTGEIRAAEECLEAKHVRIAGTAWGGRRGADPAAGGQRGESPRERAADRVSDRAAPSPRHSTARASAVRPPTTRFAV